MSGENPKHMLRDVFIEQLYERMRKDSSIYFLSADFGAPIIDKLRSECARRFINVGIAEQNLINVASGLALEGFTVYAYGIATFLIMRAYEQIRINLALLASLRKMNVNLIGVGYGLSYDVSGPTHHCLEDLGIMRILPNIEIISPCDEVSTRSLVEYTLDNNFPKYIRLDGKPLPAVYDSHDRMPLLHGFKSVQQGSRVCIVSTGYMTHKALRVVKLLKEQNVNCGVVDVFLFKTIDRDALRKLLFTYEAVVTLEEGFMNKGGLDALISGVLTQQEFSGRFLNLGFGDEYVFEIGDREYLYSLYKLDDQSISATILDLVKKI